ncbi:polysaccharide lyase family 7 protein [Shewanella maritima]|uniref:Polysaccharide lyase family 7 protein n=1 Tax=Shewanella maritima TaxID=2520507 RepID=A0A411PHM6_9GAMM|nr:polysaccharide lyase family 7 protein [Shewanella maritima]QBF82988.1 polysaccharide lyase family 7 protein [Shewanella maritima]
MRKTTTVVFLTLGFALYGCGGSSGGEPSPGPEPSPGTCPECDWNIEQWKLTLPISRDDFYGSGGDSAAELIPADCSGKQTLSNDTRLDYFWVDSNDKRAHFYVNLGDKGATTTNSNYVRSELRELYNYQTSNRCSSSNQNWAINNSHTLSSELQIEQYPQISGIAPKVILGQIHGYEIKQALVKLLWEGENTPVRVIFNDKFEPNNETCSDCQSFSVDLGTVKAHDNWRYDIHADKQAITVSTTINGVITSKELPWGVPVEANDGDKYTLTKDWLNETFYFKAGIYPQIKPDTQYQNQIFEVSFNKINIEHK